MRLQITLLASMVRYTKSDPPMFFASFSPTGQVLEQQNPKYKRDKHEGEAYGCEQLECPRMEGHSILNAKRSLIYLDQTTLKESLDKRSPRQHSLVRVAHCIGTYSYERARQKCKSDTCDNMHRDRFLFCLVRDFLHLL
jgi:hypothetical protein